MKWLDLNYRKDTKTKKTSCPSKNEGQCPAQQCPHKKPENECPFEDLEDCPYWDRRDCPEQKNEKQRTKGERKKCYHTNENGKINSEIKKFGRKARWMLSSALVAALLSHFFLKVHYPEFNTLIFGLLMSIIAGLSLSYIIDLPESLRRNEESILSALTTDGYLKKLNNERLRELRERITELLYKKDAPRLPKGLIKLDHKICDLLMEPYYERYHRRDILKTTDHNGKPYVEKTVCISYNLINPLTHSRQEDIRTWTELFIAEGDTVETLINVEKAEIYIDNQPPKNIAKEIKFHKDINPEMRNYNCRTRWSKSEATYEPFIYSYNNQLSVEICYKLLLPQTDIWHGTKLRHAAKSFHFDCSYDKPDIQTYGLVMGTLAEDRDCSVSNITPNNITIDVRNWLLPKNGIVIVFGPIAK